MKVSVIVHVYSLMTLYSEVRMPTVLLRLDELHDTLWLSVTVMYRQ